MTECCCGNNGASLLYSCSGGADVGALADAVTRKLAQEGYGKISCLAGVGADISGFIASAENARLNITIDGCPLRCAAKNLQNQGQISYSVVLSEIGFEKGKIDVDQDTIDAALKILKNKLKKETTSSSSECCCK